MTIVIDYGMGNLFSVENALKHLGASVKVSSSKEDLKKADKIILPGVGAFRDGIKNLKNLGITSILEEEVLKNKKPFLGICLGMQLMASVGEEGGEFDGLGWIPGRVKRLNVDESKFRVPHVGWNDIAPGGSRKLFSGIESPIFYFVHSFHFVPEDRSLVSAYCDYSENFAAAIEWENIFGTQFHPEKSQKNGLKLLENFLKI